MWTIRHKACLRMKSWRTLILLTGKDNSMSRPDALYGLKKSIFLKNRRLAEIFFPVERLVEAFIPLSWSLSL